MKLKHAQYASYRPFPHTLQKHRSSMYKENLIPNRQYTKTYQSRVTLPTTSHHFLVVIKFQSAMYGPSPNSFQNTKTAISSGIQEMRGGGVPPVGGLQ